MTRGNNTKLIRRYNTKKQTESISTTQVIYLFIPLSKEDAAVITSQQRTVIAEIYEEKRNRSRKTKKMSILTSYPPRMARASRNSFRAVTASS